MQKKKKNVLVQLLGISQSHEMYATVKYSSLTWEEGSARTYWISLFLDIFGTRFKVQT